MALALPFVLGASHAGAVPAERVLDRVAAGHDVSIVVAAAGETIYAHDAATPRTPASVQKVLLTMALFDALGPGHRITTRVVAQQPADGVVEDLWIAGGGDPSMVSGPGDATHTGTEDVARRIVESGVTRITGRIIADSSLFDDDWHAPGWQPWSRSFVARPIALALDGNHSSLPAPALATELTRALERRGITVRGEPATGTAPAGIATIARIRSAPLSALVAHMNATSSNFYAEMLGKLLGARTFGTPGTIAQGARAVEVWAKQRGVNVTSHDSSGLSYTNRLSALDLVRLLEKARRQPWGPALRASLPGAGRGTLSGRLAGVPVRAKTGTLWSGDSVLAGWVRLRGGGIAEFAVMAHDETKSLEDALVRTVEHSVVLPKARQSVPLHSWHHRKFSRGREVIRHAG